MQPRVPWPWCLLALSTALYGCSATRGLSAVSESQLRDLPFTPDTKRAISAILDGAARPALVSVYKPGSAPGPAHVSVRWVSDGHLYCDTYYNVGSPRVEREPTYRVPSNGVIFEHLRGQVASGYRFRSPDAEAISDLTEVYHLAIADGVAISYCIACEGADLIGWLHAADEQSLGPEGINKSLTDSLSEVVKNGDDFPSFAFYVDYAIRMLDGACRVGAREPQP